MKKIISIVASLAMLLPLALTGVCAADEEVTDDAIVSNINFEFQKKIEVEDEFGLVLNGHYNGHGGHQTRIIHTSRGDYLSSSVNQERTSSSLVNGFSLGLTELAVMKVPTGSTETVNILQHTIPQQTTHISIIADKDENIWAGFVYEDNFRDQFDAHGSSIMIELFRIDADTDQVTFYSTTLPGVDINGGGVGYASFFYDESIDSIIIMAADGALNALQSYLYWKVFNCSTKEWAEETHTLPTIAGRNAYPFFVDDGKGGFIVVTNRNPGADHPDYFFPEKMNNDGIPKDLLRVYFPGGREPMDYCFDQINAYYIPDANSSENVIGFPVYEPDYSRIKGTLEERHTVAFRSTNEYPAFANNNGGDVYLDADGYLHVTLAADYFLYAWDWTKKEAKWVHVVYDPKTGEKLSESVIFDEMADNQEYEARLYGDPFTGEIFILTPVKSKILIKKAVGSPTEGYTYETVALSEDFPSLNSDGVQRTLDCLCLADDRGNSTNDGILSLQVRTPTGYDLIRVNLNYTTGTEENPVAVDAADFTELKALVGRTTYYKVSGTGTYTLAGDENTAVSLNGSAVEAVGGKFVLNFTESENVIGVTNNGIDMARYAVEEGDTAPAVDPVESDTEKDPDESKDPEETAPTEKPQEPAKTPIGPIIGIAAAVVVIAAVVVGVLLKKKK